MDFELFYSSYFPFWQKLLRQDQELLCQNSAVVHFDKSQNVHDNDGCSGLFILKSGKLRLYMLSEGGKEVTLYRLTPGDVCMLSASCVLQSITFEVYVEAEMPSECIRISGAAFRSVSEHMPEVKNYALEIAVQRFSDVMWVFQQIMFMKMDRRLAIFLLDETSSGDGVVNMTHDQISRHLGTAREVITRILKRFSSEGWISVTRSGIRITDRKPLRDLAYDADSSGF